MALVCVVVGFINGVWIIGVEGVVVVVVVRGDGFERGSTVTDGLARGSETKEAIEEVFTTGGGIVFFFSF